MRVATQCSFDITSNVDLQEVDNALNQARKEVAQRYDFKGSKASIEFDTNESKLVLVADDDFKLNALWEIVQTRLVRRNVPVKNLSRGPALPAANSTVRQEIALQQGIPSEKAKDIVKYLKDAKGLDTKREKEIGQHIGYRYDVNLVPDYNKITPFLEKYMELMGWDDLNWLEDVHMGYEEGRPAIFDRNVNGWVTIPKGVKLPDNQQDRDMMARELLIKFQMSSKHPLVDLKKAYKKFW